MDDLSNEGFRQEVAFWKEYLTGAPVGLSLPRDQTERRTPLHQRGTASFKLSVETLARLRTFSKALGVTIEDALLGVFFSFLSRYTGQRDVVIGMRLASLDPTNETVGPPLAHVPIRVQLADDWSGTELVANVARARNEIRGHAALLAGRLVDERAVHGLIGNQPCRVTFEYEVHRTGESSQDTKIDSDQFMYDIALTCLETSAGLTGLFAYDALGFDRGTIERMAANFLVLLDGFLREPEVPVVGIPLLAEAERRKVVHEWNETKAEFPRDKCVHHLFEDQVERTPEAVAVSFEHNDLTYRELDRRAGVVARHLRSLGVRRGVRVGLCAERSLEMVVGLLGILKAGGAYVPLDPAFPSDRLAFMVTDAEVRVLVTANVAKSKLPPCNARLVALDQQGPPLPDDGYELAADEDTGPEAVAYVIYTSGSTGRPKGVEVQHRSVVNFLSSMAKQPGLCAKDVLLAVTTLSFDIAGLELYLPLTVGARLVLATSAATRDGATLLQMLVKHGITAMQATPLTWRLLLAAGWKGGEGLKVICGGEALPRDLARELLRRTPNLWNMYGPTETTIWSTCCRLEGPLDSVPIGRPIANTSCYVLDPTMQPTPIGVPGELHIGGVGVARGYLNQQQLTQERFVPNPFESGGRLYKTGDIVRYRPDGALEFLGRSDHQVKIRGFRIETGEIETHLAQHPGVRDAAVIARAADGVDKHLVAYYVGEASPTELRAHLEGKLPAYMIPSAFVALRRFPVTSNGKLDRSALPAPEAAPEAGGGVCSATAPRQEGRRVGAAQVLRAEIRGGGTTSPEAFRHAERYVREAIGEVTGVSPDEISKTGELESIGFGSLHTVHFLRHVAYDLGVSLGTFQFTNATIPTVTSALLDKLTSPVAEGNAPDTDQPDSPLEVVRRIAREIAGPAADAVDREARFPREAIDALKQARMMSALVPRDLGGLGCTMVELGAMCEALAAHCASAGMVFAMHHLQLASILRHAMALPFYKDYIADLVEGQYLIASATSEVGIGGDLRTSKCAVLHDRSGHFKLEKNCSTISYGAETDDILLQARRGPEAAPNDQVFVLVRKKDYALTRRGPWDTLGMRGTCSPPFLLTSRGETGQIFATPFADVAGETQVPIGHMLWSHVWLGIATAAVNRARSFVRQQARDKSGVPPTALRLAEVGALLQTMQTQVHGVADECDRLIGRSQRTSSLSAIGLALKMNNVKVSSSQMVVQIVNQAMLICGIMGYKNDSKFALGRHLRDAHSAALMVGNDRVLAANASMQLALEDDY